MRPVLPTPLSLTPLHVTGAPYPSQPNTAASFRVQATLCLWGSI